jgi:hypothetical protein
MQSTEQQFISEMLQMSSIKLSDSANPNSGAVLNSFDISEPSVENFQS